jgi:hypothetical protein
VPVVQLTGGDLFDMGKGKSGLPPRVKPASDKTKNPVDSNTKQLSLNIVPASDDFLSEQDDRRRQGNDPAGPVPYLRAETNIDRVLWMAGSKVIRRPEIDQVRAVRQRSMRGGRRKHLLARRPRSEVKRRRPRPVDLLQLSEIGRRFWQIGKYRFDELFLRSVSKERIETALLTDGRVRLTADSRSTQ